MTAVLAAVLLASAAGTLTLHRRQPHDWRADLLETFTDPAARKEPQP